MTAALPCRGVMINKDKAGSLASAHRNAARRAVSLPLAVGGNGVDSGLDPPRAVLKAGTDHVTMRRTCCHASNIHTRRIGMRSPKAVVAARFADLQALTGSSPETSRVCDGKRDGRRRPSMAMLANGIKLTSTVPIFKGLGR